MSRAANQITAFALLCWHDSTNNIYNPIYIRDYLKFIMKVTLINKHFCLNNKCGDIVQNITHLGKLKPMTVNGNKTA